MNKIFSILLILCFISPAFAQDTNNVRQPRVVEEPKKPKKEKAKKKSNFDGQRVYYGGTFGGSWGSRYSYFLIEPLVGYRLTQKLSTGVGLGYKYYKDKEYDYSSDGYTGRLFTRYVIIPQLYAHAEYAFESFEYCSSVDRIRKKCTETQRELVPFLLVGGGLRQVTNGGAFFIQVLFDLIQDEKSPYASGEPFISLGFAVGF